MLTSGSKLISSPVMGLQTGSQLAKIVKPVIDPSNLKIVAYSVEGPLVEPSSYLRVADVREVGSLGFIVDSQDEFVVPGDVIQLDNLLIYNFDIIHKSIQNQKGQKIGKVTDYTIDADSFVIVQLTVRRPLFKSLSDTELIIHRSQIIEINDKAIVIDEEAKIPESTRLSTPGSYVNPFRKPQVSTESKIN